MCKSPCLNCPDRRPTCHVRCEAYLNYQQKNIADVKAKNAYLRRPAFSMSHEQSIVKNQRDYYRRRKH